MKEEGMESLKKKEKKKKRNNNNNNNNKYPLIILNNNIIKYKPLLIITSFKTIYYKNNTTENDNSTTTNNNNTTKNNNNNNNNKNNKKNEKIRKKNSNDNKIDEQNEENEEESSNNDREEDDDDNNNDEVEEQEQQEQEQQEQQEQEELNEKELESEILFLQWLLKIWRYGIYSEFQGWGGTIINVQENTPDDILPLKSCYVLCLELYYLLRNHVVVEDTNESSFLRDFFELTISDHNDEVFLEHYSMLGLYFHLRHSITYEGFQYLCDIPSTIRVDCKSSGDICKDFIFAVDAYFATQIVWKTIGISQEGCIVTLSGKYEELMEMYYRIKCFLINGLIKTYEEYSWNSILLIIKNIYNTIHIN